MARPDRSVLAKLLFLLHVPAGAFAVAVLALPAASQDAGTQTVQTGHALLQRGDFAGAEEVFAAIVAREDDNALAWFFLGFARHAQGRHAEALEAHARAAAFPQTAARASYNAACAAALLDDTDGAIGWLRKAVAAGFVDRQQMSSDTELDGVRDDPRFAAILPPLLEGPGLFVEEPRLIHTFVGEGGGDEFGWVARDVGDLDDDGVHDFAATAPGHGNQSGRVYVYSSRTGELLFTRDGAPGTRLGSSVAGGVDIDGDGVPEVLAGAPAGRGPGHGYVFSGADGEVLLDLTVGEAGDQLGVKMAPLEDLDGDGVPEIVVGALGANGASGAGSGSAHVFSGADGHGLFRIDGEAAGDAFGSCVDGTRAGGRRLIAVGAMSGGPRQVGRAYVYRCDDSGAELLFVIDTDATGRNLGQYFIAFMGEVDGDGVPDVYVSDWNNAAKGPSTGRVFVHSGATGERLLTLTGSVAGEGFGTSQSVCGDVDGDGVADLVVGAWQNGNAAPAAGRCYLYSCADGELLTTWTSKQQGDTLGFDSVGLGDVDGDGATDFLFTSAWSTVKANKQGRVFLVAGPSFEE